MYLKRIGVKKIMKHSLFMKGLERCIELLNSKTYRERHKRNRNDFTRKRKMDFSDIVKCLLNFMRKSLSLELFRFHRLMGADGMAISKQAFSKARRKIDPLAFVEMYHYATAELFLGSGQEKRYHGYRVFAMDGSELEIAPTPENKEYYGTRSGTEACRARASVLCEIFDGVIVDAIIETKKIGERELANRHLDYYAKFACKKDLIIFDRGYPSKALIARLFSMNIKFLMRLPKSFQTQIDTDTRSDFYYPLVHEGTTYKLRVIKLLLDSGEVEMLITNLGRRSFKMREFKELYALRWPIETKYNLLKSCLLLEQFTGKHRICIEQDFYATILLANMAAFAKMEADADILCSDAGKQLKYRRVTNQQILIGMLKDDLIRMMLLDDPQKREQIYRSVMQQVVRYKTDIRPGRHFDRPSDTHHRRKLLRKGVL